jgi:hypothetical protein
MTFLVAIYIKKWLNIFLQNCQILLFLVFIKKSGIFLSLKSYYACAFSPHLFLNDYFVDLFITFLIRVSKRVS